LDAAQKADMRAYMSLANNILGNAEVLNLPLLFVFLLMSSVCSYLVIYQLV
jgi:hypothetical protein